VVVHVREDGVVDLEDEPGLVDGEVLLPQCLGDGVDVLFTCAGAPVSAVGISGLFVKNSLNRSRSRPSQSSGTSWSVRISKPVTRDSAYAAQLDLPNSPSFTTDRPTSDCRATTSATAAVSSRS
jgi:hypothetical protein